MNNPHLLRDKKITAQALVLYLTQAIILIRFCYLHNIEEGRFNDTVIEPIFNSLPKSISLKIAVLAPQIIAQLMSTIGYLYIAITAVIAVWYNYYRILILQ